MTAIIRVFTDARSFFSYTNVYDGDLTFRNNKAYNNDGILVCELLINNIKKT